MRVKLSKNELEELFQALEGKSFSISKLSPLLMVSERNLRDWKNGKISMPEKAYLTCLELAKLKTNNFNPTLLKDYWHIKQAAKKGALARMKLYGNIGTPEGRRKGGLASIKTHRINMGAFKVLRIIVKPKASEDLAELLGILVGDGHLSNYQVSMTTNSITDRKHASFVKELIVKIFNLPVKISFKKNENAMTVVTSSKNLVDFLHSMGMPIGNKIKNKLCVPAWILSNTQYQKAFLKGLFDTDGCIYLDKHLIRGKLYKHMGWTITSYADKLIAGIIEILKKLDFNPTYRASQKSVYLRKQNEIRKYFTEIGTHNSKHKERYLKFCGEVPKWS